MPQRMPFVELVNKVQKRTITKPEMAELFEQDVLGSRALAPKFKLNYDAVM